MFQVYTYCVNVSATICDTQDIVVRCSRVLFIILVLIALTGTAGASMIDSCTTITSPGTYSVSTLYPDTDECIRVESDGVVLEGGTVHSGGVTENIVVADGVTGVTIRNMDFVRGEHNIVTGDTADLLIEGNSFSQQTGSALLIEYGETVDIIDNDFTQVDDLSVSGSFSGQVRFVDNTFTQGDDDIYIVDSDMGTLSILHNAFSQGGDGVVVEDATMNRFSVINNDFTHGDNGIILRDSTVSTLDVERNGFTQGIGIEVVGTDISDLSTAKNVFTQIENGIVVHQGSSLSSVTVEDSQFTQLDDGIRIDGDTGIMRFVVTHSEFTQTEYGIQVADISSADEFTVLETEFMQGGDSIIMRSPSAGTAVSVVNTSFTQADDAIRIEDPQGAPDTAIHCNVFVQVDYGVYADEGAGIVDATNNIWNSLWTNTRPESPGTTTLEDPVTGAPADGWSTYVSEGSTRGVSNVHFDGDHTSCPLGVNGEADEEMPPEKPTEDIQPPQTFNNYTDAGWETRAQPVGITCTDDDSGCSHIDWEISRSDGTSLRDGSDDGHSTMVLVGQHYAGALYLSYRGVDNAGNVEDWNEQRVRITLASRDNYTDDGWKNTPQPVRLECEHAQEKDCGLEWRIWDGPVEVRSGGVMHQTTDVLVGTDADGPLILEYWANDADGNVEGPANEQRVRIDKIAPWVELEDTDRWFGDELRVSVEHGDHGYSGVDTDRCEYRTSDDGAEWSEWQSYGCDEISVPVGEDAECSVAGEGTCGVETRVYDRAGNSNSTTGWYNIDLTAPEINCDIHENGCTQPEPVGAGSEVAFHPNATDPYSGVARTYICENEDCDDTFCVSYAPDETCEYTTSAPYGSYTYCVKAVDRVGNENIECGFAFSVKGMPGDQCALDAECLMGECEAGICDVGDVDPPGISLR